MTKNGGVTFKDDTALNLVAINGPVDVRAVVATTDEASGVVVGLYHHDGHVQRQIAAVTVPTLAGTDGTTAAEDLLNSDDNPWMEIDERGNRMIRLAEGESLRVSVDTAPASGKRVDVVSFGWKENS